MDARTICLAISTAALLLGLAGCGAETRTGTGAGIHGAPSAGMAARSLIPAPV